MLLIGILIITIVIGLIPDKISNIFINRIGTLMFLFSAVLSYNSCHLYEISDHTFGVGSYGGLWQITTMNTGIAIFIYIIATMALLLGEGPLNERKSYQSEYPLIIALSTLGMICLISSYDLISFFLAIELQSLSLYIVATIYRESESATSAGLKYFLLGGLSSGFILLGSSLLYGLTGITNFEAFYMIGSFGTGQAGYDQIDLILLILAIGLLFKIASAPFHNWAPDVYDGVPTLVTSWIAILPKISIIIFMIEFYANIFNQFHFWNSLFLFCAFLSLLIGSILGLSQSRIKRLLAYSTISHVGFILLSLSIGSHQSIESLIFYLIQYSLTSLNIFYILIAFGQILPVTSIGSTLSVSSIDKIQTLSQFKAQFKIHPLLALSLAISFFSLAGIPPCIGFFGKFLILLSAINDGHFSFMVFIAIITSVTSTVYYLKVIKTIHFYELPQWGTTYSGENFSQPQHLQSVLNLVYTNTFIIAVLSLAIIFFIFNPTPILAFIHLISFTPMVFY
jgi:NADH-ubiquinone oxidoreductase chain 2